MLNQEVTALRKHKFFFLVAVLLATTLSPYQGSNVAGANSEGVTTAQQASEPDDPYVWNTPQIVSGREGYQNGPSIAASPVDGSVDVLWTFASDNNDGQIFLSSNDMLGGPFTDKQIAIGQDQLLANGQATHDNLGRTHFLYWSWPSTNLCDYYVLADADDNILVNEQIPGSCEAGVPRKLLGIAVDSNMTVHIAMARANTPGSLMYWQRTEAGVWTAQRESIPNPCAPGDVTMATSTGGAVMVAWKDCGQSGTGSDIFTGVRNGPNNWTVENISAACCSYCPSQSNAYLPDLAASPDGGIRAVWADGRCAGQETDIYYREWNPGNGWAGQPIVQIVANAGKSYYPVIAVDDTGESHVAWGDDQNSPVGYFRIFYARGRGTTFTAPDVPFQSWAGNAWQRDPSIDFAYGHVHLAFASVLLSPQKNNFYTYQATLMPPPCANQRFNDVCPGSFYYGPVIRLNMAGVIGGYQTAPPCPNVSWAPCFLPGNNASRAQVSKIVALGANLPINTAGGPHFSDVPPGSTFYDYIETLYNANIINGYPDGTFRPNENVKRGQLTKMTARAFGYNEPVSGQAFEDVQVGSTFYEYTQMLASRGIVSGYACGGPGEPCGAGNLPYFRPGNNVTRGQIAKIIDAARTPD